MPEQKKELICVSFGTSYPEALESIDKTEEALRAAAPGYAFRRAFTSGMIRRKWEARGVSVPGVGEALRAAAQEGVREVILQPTHVIPGIEYDRLCAEAEPFKGSFSSLRVGRPLVTNAEEQTALLTAMLEEYPPAGDTALLFMGHGTEHTANFIYASMQTALRYMNRDDAFIAAVEGWPTIEDALPLLHRYGAHRVKTIPLMLVAGDHARNDMAGRWKSILEREGFETECVIKGIGMVPSVRALYAEHLRGLISGEGNGI